MKNLTSNEHLRRRWNARRDRQVAMREQGVPSLIARLRYFYLEELPKSRIEELYNKIEDEENMIIKKTAIANIEVLREYGIETNNSPSE